MVIAIAIGLAAYVLFLAILRRYHHRHPRVAIRAARRRTTENTRVSADRSAGD